jgi:PAS domain S-box-containing protein
MENGFLVSAWKAGLKIGYHATVPGLQRGQVLLLNALVIIGSLSVIVFSICYWFIGYTYFYGPLYILPVAALVLFLNSKGKFVEAKRTFLYGSYFVIAYWCYEGRGNGNEYTLIGLAATSMLILDNKLTMFFTNLMCALLFVGYKYWHAATPFVPDPVIDYEVIPTLILLNSVAVVSFQIVFYRDLAKHYDQKLSSKYRELQVAEEELKSNNEEIQAMNEKLHGMTAALETRVKEKTIELRTYIEAIDVNLFSCINDVEGNFLQVNDPLIKASGYSREELIGKRYTILTTPANQRTHYLTRKEKLFSGSVWRGEVEHRSKYGDVYWFDCVVIPMKNEAGDIKFFLSIGLPVTERKINEQLREKAHAVLESIAFRASHDIRGPMARIKGLANLIRMDQIDQTEINMIAGLFLESIRELSAATSELVDFVHEHQDSLMSNNLGEGSGTRDGAD